MLPDVPTKVQVFSQRATDTVILGKRVVGPLWCFILYTELSSGMVDVPYIRGGESRENLNEKVVAIVGMKARSEVAGVAIHTTDK